MWKHTENSARIEIANIRFDIACGDFPVFQEEDPIFINFSVEKSRNKPDVNLKVSFLAEELSEKKRGRCIYDNDRMWTMYRDEENYWIENHPPGTDRPVWLAKTNCDFSEIILYCQNNFPQGRALANNIRYPLLQILLMHHLAQKEGVLIHAAGAEIHKKGYIFPGVSGAGKSTLTKQFADLNYFKLFSDDRMVVRKEDGIFKTFGTPWPGDAGVAVNDNSPLSAMVFIVQSSRNQISPLLPRQALERLMPVISVPWYDRKDVTSILDFLEDLLKEIPAFELQFKPDVEAVELLENFVAKL